MTIEPTVQNGLELNLVKKKGGGGEKEVDSGQKIR